MCAWLWKEERRLSMTGSRDELARQAGDLVTQGYH